MSVNAYQQYKKTQISTASQGELLLMLFDGAVRFGHQAKDMILRRDYAGANEKIVRTQDIVSELISSLNLDTGEIAENLDQLYRYIYNLLVQANVKKDTEVLDEAVHMLSELRDTWRQVVNKA